MEYSLRTWDVVGPWINRTAQTEKDPHLGGPWMPTMEDVRFTLESVEAAWKRLQPPAS